MNHFFTKIVDKKYETLTFTIHNGVAPFVIDDEAIKFFPLKV